MALTPQYVIDGLVRRGMQPHIAEGFAANFADESGFNPEAVGDNGNAFGLAQWNGPRMTGLQNFAASTGRSAGDPEAQMDFLVAELQGSESGAWGKISSAANTSEAAAAVLNHFERPAETHRARREAAYLGGTFTGGSGASDVSGGAGADDLAGLAEWAGVTPPAQEQQPTPPPSLAPTPGADYQVVAPVEMQSSDIAGLAEWAGIAAPAPVATPAEPAGVMDSIGRGLGLGTRAIMQGPADAVGLLYDPIAAAQNWAFGTNVQPLGQQAAAIIDAMGFPSPETTAERVASGAVRGAAGAAIPVGLGGQMAKAAGPLVARAGEALAASPVGQFVSGLTAGGSAQGASEAGAGPYGQFAAALGGGLLGSAVAGGMRAVAPDTAPPSQVQRTVAQAEAAGIKPMTSDVFKPETFVGRSAQRIGELVPFAGTGPARAAQQVARVAAVKDTARQFGATADASNDVMSAFLSKRGADLNRYSVAKNEVVSSVPGKVDTVGTIKAIDDQLATLRGMKTAEVSPVIAKLEDWKLALVDQDLPTVELLRKQFGEAFSAPELASVRSTGQKALSSIYGALREDMGNHIKANGQPRDFVKWKVANSRLKDMVGELDNAALSSALKKGDMTPEAIRGLLFSKKPSDVAMLYRNLPPEGKARARGAVLQEALEKSTDGENLSPQKFRTQLVKLSTPIGVFFSGQDLEAVDGLRRVLDMTSRAGETAAMGPTGVQTLPVVGGMALTDLAGGFGSGILAGGTMGLAARAFESTATRNLMMKLAKTKPNSPEEGALMRKILETLRVANTTNEGQQ